MHHKTHFLPPHPLFFLIPPIFRFSVKGKRFDIDGYDQHGYDVFGFDAQGYDILGRPITDEFAGTSTAGVCLLVCVCVCGG